MLQHTYYSQNYAGIIWQGLNIATLHDHVTGKVEDGKTPGPCPVLSTAEEAKLCDWLLEMAEVGYGRSMEELRLTVKQILDKDGCPNPFKDDLPDYD